MKLKEEITHKDLGPMMDSFVSFASEKLGIKTLPNLQYKPADPDFTSFGGYSPSGKSISIVTKGRHPMDIFRTVAHELVHCKQDEDGRIKDVAKEGETGSDIENEANALAGQIMRWYAKANPDKFSLSHMVEETMDEACWKGYHQPEGKKLKPKKGKPGQFVPNCVPNKVDEEFEKKFDKLYDGLRKQVDENLPCNREEGTDSVVWNYASHTPGQMEFLKTMSRHLAQGQYDPGDIPAPEIDKTDKRLNEEDNPPSEKELEELRKMFGGKRPSEAELKEWKKSFKIKPTNKGSTSVNEEGLGVGQTAKDKGPASYPMGGIGESCGKPHRKSVKQILDEIQEYGSMGTVAKQTSPVMENVDKDAMQCNKPRAQAHGSGETGKSHIVKACAGGKEKIIRFGQLGVKGSPKKEGESEEYANRRKRFKARHGKNIKKGKMSAAYWANKVKW